MIVALALLLAAGQAAAPSVEAETLGRRVAETGSLASLLPALIARDIDELVARHPELDDAGKAKLRSVAGDVAKSSTDRLMIAIGHQYALRLSIGDLKTLAAFNASPAAKNWRAAEPLVIATATKEVGELDLQKQAWTTYCKDPAAKCAPAK